MGIQDTFTLGYMILLQGIQDTFTGGYRILLHGDTGYF